MMKTTTILSAFIVLVFMASFTGCGERGENAQIPEEGNPLLATFDTPFGTPPFSLVENDHYLPAFKEAVEKHREEIRKIAENTEKPDFSNTIVALDRSGNTLDQVAGVYFNLRSADTNEKMQEISEEVSGMLAAHYTSITLNKKLFERVKTVFEDKDSLDLSTEESKLLEETYKVFERGGANLTGDNRKRYEEISQELSRLSTKFGNNKLAATNNYQLVIDDESDLSGLPQAVIEGAAQRAKAKGLEGKWIFTTSKSNMIPFLKFADNRALRQKLLTAHQMRCNHGDELDNKEILNKIVNLRVERAGIMGYSTHAHYVLEENMANNPGNVYELLNKVWAPALKAAKEERARLQDMVDEEGGDFKIKPWDWWYYTEKLRKARYALEDSLVKPYFTLDNVRDGAFMVIEKLFGVHFKESSDIPLYHQDVKVFEVRDEDTGDLVGILFFDPYSRSTKRGGAWMNSYRKQYRLQGKRIHPVVSVNYNFAKGTGDTPCMLNVDQTLTLFHELGHAMHGLLSRCTYKSLSGTSVPRDFVELPSQMMEHWAMHPEVLKMYARDYRSQDPIPDELIAKIEKADTFNQGFATTEYLAAAFLDMDYHTLKEKRDLDINGFEKRSMEKIGLIPEIVVRYRSTYFTHITGGYSAGYYSYIWSGVLDNDAFEAFGENGLFDPETAASLKKNIYEKGGTEDPMVLYKRFRGQEPSVQPLLRNRGFIGE